MKLPKLNEYNSGVVRIYKDVAPASNFGAKLNVKHVEDMCFVVRLDYKELSKRQQDFEFAEQMSFSLDLKIRTQNPHKNIRAKHKAVIGNTLYDISSIDETPTELFLYLTEVRELA